MESPVKHKLLVAVVLIGGILGADILSKRWALVTLSHGLTVDSGMVPMTLAYNQGIAFGLPIPSAGRWLLVAASVFVVIMLAGLFHQAKPGDWIRITSISLVTAGALGNLIDRVRWDLGVVDFIGPFDLGMFHWPIFNVADMAITTGALMLGISLWREEAEPHPVPVPVTTEAVDIRPRPNDLSDPHDWNA
jgi:signal peptidase II